MNRSTIDLWVGVFVVAGIAGLLFLALKVGNLATFSTSQIYQVQAKFANIGGLKVRAPVKSAGVVIGRVADIRFDNDGVHDIHRLIRIRSPADFHHAEALIQKRSSAGELVVGQSRA